MARQYRSRLVQVTAIDSRTALNVLGSDTAPGPLFVPARARLLAGIYVAAGCDVSATGSANALIRIEGPGLPEGPEVVAGPSFGVTVATGAQHVINATWIPIGARVTIANEISIFGEMIGADVGLLTVGVTLVFV